MDYEFYLIRMIGWGPALLVLAAGVVISIWTGRITRRGCSCLLAAAFLQSFQVLLLPIAKDVYNKLSQNTLSMTSPLILLTQDRSPRSNRDEFPPYVGTPFQFPQGPVDDHRFYPGSRASLGWLSCPSTPPQGGVPDETWRQFHTTRWKRTIWDVLPDSLLTALIWGLILFAVFDRPVPPKFLAEVTQPPPA